MPGSAGSKYGIKNDGVPVTKGKVMKKLDPLKSMPSEVTIKIYDANVEKPDNWRDVMIDGGCAAFYDGKTWLGASGAIKWPVRWWADFPKVNLE